VHKPPIRVGIGNPYIVTLHNQFDPFRQDRSWELSSQIPIITVTLMADDCPLRLSTGGCERCAARTQCKFSP
jgi:hypothetical protein